MLMGLLNASDQEGHHEACWVGGRWRRRGVGLSGEVAAPQPGPVGSEAVLVEAEAGHHLGLERRAHLEVDRLDDGQQGEPRQQRFLLHSPAGSRADEVISGLGIFLFVQFIISNLGPLFACEWLKVAL